MDALKKLCGTDLTIEEVIVPKPDETEKGHIVLRVRLKGHGDMLEKSRFGWTEFKEDYLDKCARDVIEDRRFGDMLSACEVQAAEKEQKDALPPGAVAREDVRATRREEGARPPM